MRIIIDIGHPAHVHLFKHFAWKMQKMNHTVLFTCRDREFVTHLLSVYGFVYRNFGRHYKGIAGKIFGLIKNDLQMLLTSFQYRPDVYVSHGSTIAGHSAFVMRKPHIALEDTFNMEQVRLSLPFSDVILTATYPHANFGKKEIRYPGYHELAYLHPNVFVPDPTIFKHLGLQENDKYAIIRFVAWAASHDIGHKGMTSHNKIELVLQLSKYLKVFISSEGELPPELRSYQIKISPERMHDAMYFAQFFVGESATMAAECAVIGTPAVYINDSQLGYTSEQAKYGLLYSFTESIEDQGKAISKALELAKQMDVKKEFTVKREKMLADKIDVTSFLVWFVEDYPKSRQTMKQKDFSYDRFK
jgi:uncharacterized protein